MEVQVLSSIPVGPFSDYLLVDYRYNGQKTTHKVPIFGEVLGDFRVTPKRLFFGLIKDPETFSKNIAISRLALTFSKSHPWNQVQKQLSQK